MDFRISNFTYVSMQTLQNAFPEGAEQRSLQTAAQSIVEPQIKAPPQEKTKKGSIPKPDRHKA
jgi:hypothetical protein